MLDPARLRPMLEAGSVAIVGASTRPGSVGEQMVVQLVGGGFSGSIYPVNPKYQEVHGLRCHPSLTELPGPVDLVLLGVPNEVLEEQLRQAAAVGARAAVIFASAHEDPPGDPPLAARLATIAEDAAMQICGANCMGFVNLDHRLRALGFPERHDLEPGSIAWISHSGSAFSALLHNDRRIRFNLAVSPGQELTATVADFVAYALELPSTRLIALFLEAVRDPSGFRSVLHRATERDIPVVALKVGREAATKDLILAHSGALAGDDGAYEALFESHGVLRVGTLDEMAGTLELLASGRRARPGGLAAIHDSGGERVHLIDVAAEFRVPFARISDRTRAALTEQLDPGLPAVNPLDAWGTGHDFDRIFLECIRILAGDPDTAAVALVVDLTEGILEEGYARVAEESFGATDVPLAVLSNLASAIDRPAATSLRAAGVPVLEGTAMGMAAFRHSFDLRDWRSLPALRSPDPVPEEVRNRWRARLAQGDAWSELEALSLLSDYGLPVVPARAVAGRDDVVEAARVVGWPVVLKTAVPGVGHKSEVGGVVTGLEDEAAVASAYIDLAQRLGPEAVVAAEVPAGIELALGVVRDPQFGPVVLVAAGGVLIELLHDRRLALPPLDEVRARRLVDRLTVRPLLDGARGGPPADVKAVVGAIVRLSVLASDLGDELDALDVNPLLVGQYGCMAVDALVVPRSTPASR